jgi:superfamily II DNA or RNA helicase
MTSNIENFSHSTIDNLPLRAWQSNALARWCKNDHHGIAEVATAGGKTRFAIECINIWKENKENPKILIIVPTTALQDQWVVTISEVFNIDISEISAWPENKNLDKIFQVIVVNSAREYIDQFRNENFSIFMIADECHRYASAENSKIFELQCDATLGITATAARQYDEGLKDILIPALGRVIYEYSLIEASADNIISKFELINVEVPMNSDEVEEYSKLTKRLGMAISQGDTDKIKMIAILRSSVSKNTEARIPAACALVEKNVGKRIVIFHEEIQAAEVIHRILEKRNILSAIYHSKISPDLRRANLKMFRKGMVQVLVCIRALDEGIDIPEAEVAIIAAATNSKRQRVQRIGRVVRKHEDKEIASVYSIYATDSERDILVQEASSMAEIAHVSWLKMGAI